MTPIPFTRDLVLVGGGHTHALVLREFGMTPLPGLRITLVNPGPTAPYTGMLPGHIAGHYGRGDLEIDLYRLARFAGARLLTDTAEGIDLAAREVHLASGRRVAYDVAAIDIGVTSDLPALPGFAAHGIAAKPLGPLAARWRGFLDAGGAEDVAVIGGGVAGVELALAMTHRLRASRPHATATVIERDGALTALPAKAARRLRTRLREMGLRLMENTEVAGLSEAAVHLGDGGEVRSAFTVSAAGARPHPWIADTGLGTNDGYIAVDRYLATSDPSVFAAGDCAHLGFAPRPKAGVYAVRAAPVLAQNLRAALAGGARHAFRPQRDYLKLVSLGKKAALAEKAGLVAEGAWVWAWKDRIDRTFMDKLNRLKPMRRPPLPAQVARGVRDEMAGKAMLCGGCGAKVGPGALAGALADLPAPPAGLARARGDDAALLDFGDARQVLTTDHLAAFTGDPALMARIAALHAMGDVWAMGGTPVAALAQITLPRMSAALQARTLAEVMTAAAQAFAEAGAAIAGGHTTLGTDLTIGFALAGRAPPRPIGLDGAEPGDALILTRPLGSGVLLAADMALEVRGDDLAALFQTTARPQGDAAVLLSGARAMTDVTGFGLLGHLQGIVAASGLGAEVTLDTIPFYAGAVDLAARGIRSSIWEANRAAVDVVLPDRPEADLLFDPQTAGGLLAAVAPETAEDLVAALSEAGHRAARIGALIDGPPAIRLR
ncbi:MAG: selenide, water dikinase SelD [Paracoccaceae bacterium]|nr:selenide, water dikinase SelD [Paracoccaceae bacterium]